MTHADQVVLACRGLVKVRGGRVLLRGLDLVVRRGEIVGLVGANGSGKTTALDIITGYLRVDHGAIWLFGQAVWRWSSVEIACAGVGRTFQEMRLPTDMEVGCLLELARQLRVSRGLSDASPLCIEERFDLLAIRTKRIGELSYGRRKAVALTCAFLRDPRMLVLDEPFAALDPDAATCCESLIGQMAARGIGVLLVDHDLDRVERLCDKVVELRDAEDDGYLR